MMPLSDQFSFINQLRPMTCGVYHNSRLLAELGSRLQMKCCGNPA